MKIFKRLILGCILFLSFLYPILSAQASAKKEPLIIRVFHLPGCGACLKVRHDIIPLIAAKYGDKVEWVYIDISDQSEYSRFLLLEKKVGRPLGTPTILIGPKVLVGTNEAADSLDKTIQEALGSDVAPISLEERGIDLLERFRKFGPLAVIGAGLVDGINPCAFTVIVFFVSFLTVAGYKRKETALIGAVYIFAVFATYLAIGLGCFKALYSLKAFYLVSKLIYSVVGALTLYLGGLALKDYFLFKKTGKTEEMALQLPRFIKNRIHSIVGEYYRKDKKERVNRLDKLLVSAIIVGFLVSLLEAVCTGQMYVPTIVFVLKEASLRARALSLLFLYNLMFILPLVFVLIFSLAGASSKEYEAFARRHMGMIKIAMAAVFLALGFALLLGA
jgi:cytochrome c biogenesis protein CcdA